VSVELHDIKKRVQGVEGPRIQVKKIF